MDTSEKILIYPADRLLCTRDAKIPPKRNPTYLMACGIFHHIPKWRDLGTFSRIDGFKGDVRMREDGFEFTSWFKQDCQVVSQAGARRLKCKLHYPT